MARGLARGSSVSFDRGLNADIGRPNALRHYRWETNDSTLCRSERRCDHRGATASEGAVVVDCAPALGSCRLIAETVPRNWLSL